MKSSNNTCKNHNEHLYNDSNDDLDLDCKKIMFDLNEEEEDLFEDAVQYDDDDINYKVYIIIIKITFVLVCLLFFRLFSL